VTCGKKKSTGFFINVTAVLTLSLLVLERTGFPQGQKNHPATEDRPRDLQNVKTASTFRFISGTEFFLRKRVAGPSQELRSPTIMISEIVVGSDLKSIRENHLSLTMRSTPDKRHEGPGFDSKPFQIQVCPSHPISL
jgi:hypothetical protein